jgi:hypothetical protein
MKKSLLVILIYTCLMFFINPLSIFGAELIKIVPLADFEDTVLNIGKLKIYDCGANVDEVGFLKVSCTAKNKGKFINPLYFMVAGMSGDNQIIWVSQLTSMESMGMMDTNSKAIFADGSIEFDDNDLLKRTKKIWLKVIYFYP